MLQTGLVALLEANGPLMSQIDACIYPVQVPNTAGPNCLSYQIVSSRQRYTFDKRQRGEVLIQFDAWSKTYAGAENIQTALADILDTFQGVLPDGTHILAAFRENTIDFQESEAHLFRVMQEYRILYIEAG